MRLLGDIIVKGSKRKIRNMRLLGEILVKGSMCEMCK